MKLHFMLLPLIAFAAQTYTNDMVIDKTDLEDLVVFYQSVKEEIEALRDAQEAEKHIEEIKEFALFYIKFASSHNFQEHIREQADQLLVKARAAVDGSKQECKEFEELWNDCTARYGEILCRWALYTEDGRGQWIYK